MTIETIGSLGEFIAAIATIATLFYLARQIRQGSDVTRAASQQALLDTFFSLAGDFSRDDEIAQIVGAGLLDFESLDDRAKTKFTHTLGPFIGNIEKGIRLLEDDLIDRDTLDGVARAMVSALQSPGGAQWWASYRAVVVPIVVEYLEARLAEPQEWDVPWHELFPYWASWGAERRSKDESTP